MTSRRRNPASPSLLPADGRRARVRVWIGRTALTGALLAVIVPMLAYLAYRVADARLGPPPIAVADDLSVTVLDRSERLLRAYTTADDMWRLPVEIADVDPRYVRMLLAFEDRRFGAHFGVDPIAIMRAAAQFVRHGRIVSGGSTLTMQVARLLERRHGRDVAGKLRQMVRALQLEARLSKDEILRLYLRLAPFGGNIEGVRAATLAYFGKEPRRLSDGEAALLVALPQSPEARRPGRRSAATRRARDRVLDVAQAAGLISRAGLQRARGERVPTARRPFPQLAPHLADAEIARAAATNVHRLTIERTLQRSLERLVAQHAAALGPKISAAVIVADHKTGEILAQVGSAGYLDAERLGGNDMTRAVRSPGSTLKPVIYGLGFEAGLAHPQTLIEDRAVRFGLYAPKNFDQDFHGTVTIRHALAQSLNIPAVQVLDAVGPERLVGRLRDIGLDPQLPAGAEPSLAVALGGVGLTLTDLARLYASLANEGQATALSVRRTSGATARPVAAPAKPTVGTPAADTPAEVPRARQPARLMSDVAAWYVTDILKDAPPPVAARAGRIAYKTGTSYGYRDAWAVGYDGRHTVAVWVGRADASSVPGLAGRTAAAPILFDAFQRIGESRAPLAKPPRGVVRAAGADLPPPLKRFRGGASEETAGGLPDDAGADRVPARSRGTGGRRGRRSAGRAEGGRGRAAADLAGRRTADHVAGPSARGDVGAAGRRLLQGLRDRCAGPRRPRHGAAEVAEGDARRRSRARTAIAARRQLKKRGTRRQ